MPTTCRILLIPAVLLAAIAPPLLAGPPASSQPRVDTPPGAGAQPGIPIIELRGDAGALGRQHGERLGREIRALHEAYLKGFFASPAQYDAALQVASVFANFMRPEHKAEMFALADTTNIEPNAALLANSFLDLTPMTACSTIALPARAAPDDVARFGRTLDFDSLGVADAETVVLVFHPKDRYAFAAVTWPGLIGALSGMNEHGLTLANMEVSREGSIPHAMPYMLLYRTVLERCRTVDEAIALLGKTGRQTANNLMLMDAKGNRAVVEITPARITVRRAPESAALISTNHQRGRDLDTPGRCDRFDRLHDAAADGFGRIDLRRMQQLLDRVSDGDRTLQAMIFEPANRVIHLAAGSHATRQAYQRIDLKPYFDAGPNAAAATKSAGRQ